MRAFSRPPCGRGSERTIQLVLHHPGHRAGRNSSSRSEGLESFIRRPYWKCLRIFVSPEAAALQRIESEHDVLFVVAGTNDPGCSGDKRIGAPADSINSLVVNAVRLDGSPCSYARSWRSSFFGKPDVSYYGGDFDQPLQTCWERRAFHLTKGTSFAAPWVARKLAYLIHIAGFSREAAKALVIDAACGWGSAADSTAMGYGIVPKRIENILETGEDDIKFIITGASMAYETYTHNIGSR